MLSSQLLFRIAVATLSCASCLVAGGAATAAGAAAGGGVPATAALPVMPPTVLAGPAVSPKQGAAAASLACALGTAQQCFTQPANPVSGSYLNVGAFFDELARTNSQHFVVKLFVPPAGSRLVVRGVGYHTTSTGDIMRRVGVLKTSASAPILPRPEDLTELQVGNVESAASRGETCVEFAEDDRPTLEPGEAAWLVLQFPDLPADVDAGILIDTDATDEDCDFLTPDAGRYWYRPDPRATLKVDWAVTVYTEPAAIKQQRGDTWTSVRTVYR